MALPLVLAAMIMVTLAAALTHQAALDIHRQARTALAVARAREAAGSGLAMARSGGLGAGVLAGGASWLVGVTVMPSGERVLCSTGTVGAPSPAIAEVIAVVDSTGRTVHRWVTLRR